MKAYSLDLRERVVAARQAGRSEGEVAGHFSVSVSFVAKLLRRHRTRGSAAALPPGRGPAPDVDAAALAQLTACLRRLRRQVVQRRLSGASGPALRYPG